MVMKNEPNRLPAVLPIFRLSGFLLLTLAFSGCLHQENNPHEFIAREILSPQRYAELVQLLAQETYPVNLNGKLRGFSEREVLQAMWSNRVSDGSVLHFSFAQSPETSAEIFEMQLLKGHALTRRAFAAAVTGQSPVPIHAESFQRRPMEATWRAIPPWRRLSPSG